MRNESSIAQFPTDRRRAAPVVFVRAELSRILDIYGRMVAAGHWRDYAIDGGATEARFSIFRRASEMPVYSVVKRPGGAARQGAWSLHGMDGRVLRRGHDLAAVLAPLERRLLKLVD